jgi:hypothetical protein
MRNHEASTWIKTSLGNIINTHIIYVHVYIYIVYKYIESSNFKQHFPMWTCHGEDREVVLTALRLDARAMAMASAKLRGEAWSAHLMDENGGFNRQLNGI